MCVRLVGVGHTDDDTLPHSKRFQTFETTCCRVKTHIAHQMPLSSSHPLLLCVQDWGGVHTNVLKQALKKLDRKRQVHRCLSLNMKNIDSVVSDLVQVQPVLCCLHTNSAHVIVLY